MQFTLNSIYFTFFPILAVLVSDSVPLFFSTQTDCHKSRCVICEKKCELLRLMGSKCLGYLYQTIGLGFLGGGGGGGVGGWWLGA